MFTLRSRLDKYRFALPDEFIPEEIIEKYTKILTAKHSFFTKPIDLVNESILKIQVLGFNGGTIAQDQPRRGIGPVRTPGREAQNQFMHTATDYNYRSAANPEALVDKTFNVTFRHTFGYLSYFILFESFMYQYTRDTEYKQLNYNFYIDLLSNKGSVFSRLVLMDPLIDGMDMLDLDFSLPIANSLTFNVIFKYSNFDYQFINYDNATYDGFNTVYDEDAQFLLQKEPPLYVHNRTYTKYNERTGEVEGIINPIVLDINLKNSGIDQDADQYYLTELSLIDIITE